MLNRMGFVEPLADCTNSTRPEISFITLALALRLLGLLASAASYNRTSGSVQFVGTYWRMAVARGESAGSKEKQAKSEMDPFLLTHGTPLW